LNETDALLGAAWDQELEKCKASLSYYAFNHLSTKDEHDRKTPVKRLPYKKYLEVLFDNWQDGESIQFVAKSRQLMVSWALCTYASWTARFAPHQLVLFQSKKSEDAQKMVFQKYANQARCSFIELNLPPFLRVCWDGTQWMPVGEIDNIGTEGNLIFPNGSRIEAIPQGPSQIEGRVPSLYLNDEATLQEEWLKGHEAALPCLMGTVAEECGRGVTVATMRLPSTYGTEISNACDVDPDLLCKGVANFRSAESGTYTLRVHYSADPAKDPDTEAGNEWLRRTSALYTGGTASVAWQQHYEINPLVRDGETCLPMMPEIAHRIIIPPIPIESQIGWTYDSGFDWGARNHTVWHVYGNSPAGDRYMVHELSLPANKVGGIFGISQLMKEHPLFHRVNARIQADPSIWNKDQNNQTGGLISKAQLFRNLGVHLVRAKQKGQDADDVALERLAGYYWVGWESDDFDPRFFIFNTCEATIKFWPQLHYEEHPEASRSEKSLREQMHDLHMDQWDAFKYAEADRPTPAVRKGAPPVGSMAYLRNLIKSDNRQYTKS
jgi:hypothetical protein